MITIEVKLKNNTYGATPWGEFASSGGVEMPPSPLRLVRSIGSGMFTELEALGIRPIGNSLNDTNGSIDLPPAWEALFLKLASVQPGYYIPNYETAGRQTYRPKDSLNFYMETFQKGEQTSRMLVDTFALFDEDDSSIFIQYNIDLSVEEKEMLNDALSNLQYLGRSEYDASWSLVDELPSGKTINCFPDPSGNLSSMRVNTEITDPINTVFKSTKQTRYEGYTRNPAITECSYTMVFNEELAQGARDVETTPTPERAVFLISSDKPLDTKFGLKWTDRLHKALVSKLQSSRFTGFRDGVEIPEPEKIWLSWQANALGDIQSLVVDSPTGFSKEEKEALLSVTRLYGDGDEANLELISLTQEGVKTGTRFITTTPVLLYALPRKDVLHRTAEGQIINTINWSINGNQWGEENKIEDLKRNRDRSISGHVPGIGKVSVKLIAILKDDVVNERGNRKSPADWGFLVKVKTQTPIPEIGCGFARRFGAGKLQIAS